MQPVNNKPWTPPPFQQPVRISTPEKQYSQEPLKYPQQNPNPNLNPNPNFLDSSTGQLGYALGSEMYSKVSENVNSNLERVVSLRQLRTLFKVDHSYVLGKIALILFPFRHSNWSRIGNSDLGFKPPRQDLNAPDLYIPVMSFVTFVLLNGFSLGLSSKFTPDILGITSSTALFLIGLEVLFIKGGTYFLNVNGSISWSELIAYTGYKFIPLDLVKILGFLISSRLILYAIFLYLMIAFGFFTVRFEFIILVEIN